VVRSPLRGHVEGEVGVGAVFRAGWPAVAATVGNEEALTARAARRVVKPSGRL